MFNPITDEKLPRSSLKGKVVETFHALRPNLILGLGLQWIWLYAVLYSSFPASIIKSPLLRVIDYPFGTTATLSFILTALLMALLSERITYHIRRQRFQIALSIVFAVSTASLFLSDQFFTIPLVIASEVIGGALAAFMMLLWSEAYRRREPLAILVNSSLSIIIGFSVFRLISLSLPPIAMAVVLVFVPLFEMVFLFSALHGVRSMMQPQQFTIAAGGEKLAAPGLYEVPTFHKLQVSRSKFLLKMSFPFLLFGMAFGIVCHTSFAINFAAEPFPADLVAQTLLPCGIALAAVLIFLATNSYTEFEPYYRYVIPVIGVLILFATVQGSASDNYLFTFASYICLELFMWVEFCLISHRYRISPILVTGLGRAFVVFGMFIVERIYTTAPLLDFLDSRADMLHTFIVVALVLGYSLLPREQDIRAISIREELESEAAQTDTTSADVHLKRFFSRCTHVANQYLLSSRETEVFCLLAKGRNAASISKHLYISEGTVHTHTWRIYKKLNVHSQQELMDMVDMPRRQEEPVAMKKNAK